MVQRASTRCSPAATGGLVGNGALGGVIAFLVWLWITNEKAARKRDRAR
jgi:hypothetical protein